MTACQVSFGVGVAIVTAAGWALLLARGFFAATNAAPQSNKNSQPPTLGDDAPAGAGSAAAGPAGGAPPPQRRSDRLWRWRAAVASLPSLRLDVLQGPGTLAGLCWAAGNFASMVATLEVKKR